MTPGAEKSDAVAGGQPMVVAPVAVHADTMADGRSLCDTSPLTSHPYLLFLLPTRGSCNG